jgi:hypothetical protein
MTCEALLLVRDVERLYAAELALKAAGSSPELDFLGVAQVVSAMGDHLEGTWLQERDALAPHQPAGPVQQWAAEGRLCRDLAGALEDHVLGVGVKAVDWLIEGLHDLAQDWKHKVQVRAEGSPPGEEAPEGTRMGRLLRNMWRAVDFNTHAVVYFALFLLHGASGGVTSLVLPCLALVYGVQAKPRPPKDYWLGMLSYTLVVIACKYIVQLRALCPDPQEYRLAQGSTKASECAFQMVSEGGTALMPTYLEPPPVLGIYPGPSPTWFLWEVRYDIGVLLAILWRQLHLRRIGQWRANHAGFLQRICEEAALASPRGGRDALGGGGCLDMARDDVESTELLAQVILIQSICRGRQAKKWFRALKQSVQTTVIALGGRQGYSPAEVRSGIEPSPPLAASGGLEVSAGVRPDDRDPRYAVVWHRERGEYTYQHRHKRPPPTAQARAAKRLPLLSEKAYDEVKGYHT